MSTNYLCLYMPLNIVVSKHLVTKNGCIQHGLCCVREIKLIQAGELGH